MKLLIKVETINGKIEQWEEGSGWEVTERAALDIYGNLTEDDELIATYAPGQWRGVWWCKVVEE
jgi:hypothetical protein